MGIDHAVANILKLPSVEDFGIVTVRHHRPDCPRQLWLTVLIPDSISLGSLDLSDLVRDKRYTVSAKVNDLSQRCVRHAMRKCRKERANATSSGAPAHRDSHPIVGGHPVDGAVDI